MIKDNGIDLNKHNTSDRGTGKQDYAYPSSSRKFYEKKNLNNSSIRNKTCARN